uniref:Uncharacterized protein n=1 Tax=Arundo donax TaxID=35708 RepID=A0A0A9AV58_ARUDO
MTARSPSLKFHPTCQWHVAPCLTSHVILALDVIFQFIPL